MMTLAELEKDPGFGMTAVCVRLDGVALTASS